MTFDLSGNLDLLARTPPALDSLLRGIDPRWAGSSEGADTWSTTEVVAHLVHCEDTNFMIRAETILQGEPAAAFPTFDRFGQRVKLVGLSLDELLDRFARLRSDNLARVRDWNLTEQQLDRTGRHPELGIVTLRQLLATWTVHDLTHLSQIARALAARHRTDVGPWIRNLRVLQHG